MMALAFAPRASAQPLSRRSSRLSSHSGDERAGDGERPQPGAGAGTVVAQTQAGAIWQDPLPHVRMTETRPQVGAGVHDGEAGLPEARGAAPVAGAARGPVGGAGCGRGRSRLRSASRPRGRQRLSTPGCETTVLIVRSWGATRATRGTS